MCNRSESNELIIHYKSWPKSQMPGTSVFCLRSSDQVVEEYWPTGEEADIHYNYSQE
jgi:hypothetical protein